MFEHDSLALFPEIFLINATLILLIYGVVFSTSKKYDYPPLVRNVGWLGLLSVVRLEGCVSECEGGKQSLGWTPSPNAESANRREPKHGYYSRFVARLIVRNKSKVTPGGVPEGTWVRTPFMCDQPSGSNCKEQGWRRKNGPKRRVNDQTCKLGIIQMDSSIGINFRGREWGIAQSLETKALAEESTDDRSCHNVLRPLHRTDWVEHTTMPLSVKGSEERAVCDNAMFWKHARGGSPTGVLRRVCQRGIGIK